MGRTPCCVKVGLKKGRWTAEEDEILIKYIASNGEGSWRSLPKNAGLLRCGKSCRLRWINYLRSDLKRGNLTIEEEELIVKLHATLGNRWSIIARHLPGRTDNEIKNYWNSHLSRRIQSYRRISSAAIDLSKLPGGGKRRGGRTSKSSAMKKISSTTTGNDDDVNDGQTAPVIAAASREFQSVVADPADPNQASIAAAVDLDLELEKLIEDMSCSIYPPERNSEEGASLVAPPDKVEYYCGSSEVQQDELLMDWDWESMEAKLWDEAGEMGPWTMMQWDDSEETWEHGPVLVEEESGYQENSVLDSDWEIIM
ncbi:uncharacterized protein LOC141815658 [Curcuma longa]|uniref:uncharacterized protein LOC141815658 n=1 Tax=Curcuma longa TaxID=136217 RepID=UPI003D9FACF7